MWRNITGQALYQFAISLGMLYYGPSFFGVPRDSTHHLTLIFNTFVMCQLFNEINSRKLGREINVFAGIFTNKVFVGVMLFTLIAQYLMVQFGGDFVGTYPLTSYEWLVCIAIGAGGLPLGVLLRSVLAAPIPKPQPRKKIVSSPAAVARWGKVKDATKALTVVRAIRKPGPTTTSTLRRRHRVPVVGQWNSSKENLFK